MSFPVTDNCCFDPGKNKEHNQYDLLDDRNLPYR